MLYTPWAQKGTYAKVIFALIDADTDEVAKRIRYDVNVLSEIKTARVEMKELAEILHTLRDQRDKCYVHSDKKSRISRKQLAIDFPLKYDEIKWL